MKKRILPYNSSPGFINQIVNYGSKLSHFAFLHTSSTGNDTIIPTQYQWVAALGLETEISENIDCFKSLESFRSMHTGWIFGFIGYDCKNELEQLVSLNDDNLEFDTISFFVPRIVLMATDNELIAYYWKEQELTETLDELAASLPVSKKIDTFNFEPKISKNSYLDAVHRLQNHIQQGNIYEVNFCQEFYAKPNEFTPASAFLKLLEASPAPFSSFLKLLDKYAISTSPERFLKKKGDIIISQPIKGTSPRFEESLHDEISKTQLLKSIKERSENVMIVDLVRNDLSKVAEKGSVKVDELFGIYSYKYVHQMISTISAKSSASEIDILKATFPMGSMTGAPKVRAMQLIEEFESTKRGVFSGAIGYFAPNSNFDFNVVIRTLLYNETTNYLSLSVGSAITILSNPNKEYEECLLKGEVFFKLFSEEKSIVIEG